MKILSLKPNMEREQALRKLAPPGVRGFVHRWLNGNPQLLADIYIPYRLYEVAVEDRRFCSRRYYAVDAAAGTLDPYSFIVVPSPSAFVEVETRNCLPVRLAEEQTKQLAIGVGRRSMFRRGFFRLENPAIAAHLKAEFYVPYWAGFYSTQPRVVATRPADEQALTLAAINAVRRNYEGSKVRKLIQTWLTDREQEISDLEFAGQCL